MLKKYFTVSTKQTVFIQYNVIADTKEEAIKRYDDGEGELVTEEIEDSEFLRIEGPEEIEVTEIKIDITTK